MKTRVKMLKVKIKSLADEARVIRLEERRAKGNRQAPAKRADLGRGFVEKVPAYYVFKGRDDALYRELREHRLGIVRAEQRHSLLAYGFLRGRNRWDVERPGSSVPDWERVRKLVGKFGTASNLSLAHTEQNHLFEAWRLAAEPVST